MLFTLSHPLRTLTLGAAVLGLSLLGACGDKKHDGPGHDSAAHRGDSAGDHHHASKAEEAAAHTHSTKLVFSSEPAQIEPGKPAVWTMKIVDAKSGAPVPAFDIVHEKMIHLIIVSRDLTWFNHIHPEHKGNGVFTVTTTLPRAGQYVLYADYTPTGKDHEIARQEVATAGAPAATTDAALTADVIGEGGWMVRKASAAPEGMPERTEGDYQVALMPMPSTIKAGEDVMLHFQVRDAAGKPLTTLTPYLGAMGHCVILSADSKIYLHTHPTDGDHDHAAMTSGKKKKKSSDDEDESGLGAGIVGGGPGGAAVGAASRADAATKEQTKTGGAATSGASSDVMFHTNFPLPGRYKVWGQFQNNGKIITAPFVVEVVK